MKTDAVLEEIKNDLTVMDYGCELVEKLEHLNQYKEIIRNKLRDLGRFLVVLKKESPETIGLSSIFNTKLHTAQQKLSTTSQLKTLRAEFTVTLQTFVHF